MYEVKIMIMFFRYGLDFPNFFKHLLTTLLDAENPKPSNYIVAVNELRLWPVRHIPAHLFLKSWCSIQRSDNIIFDTFSEEKLKGKLAEMLSVFYTILSIGRRDISLKSGLSNIDDLGDFLDMYEGSSLFIVDELIELNQQLKDGELSKDLLDEIAKKSFETADIFYKNKQLKEVSPIFNNLGNFLNDLDLSTLEPSSLKAFDYLILLIDDLNKNLMDIFVDRIFQDVHLFEYSLENNIEFMKLNLYPTDNEDTSELDFF